MRKKILTIICACFFAFMLCGCSANVGYSISYVPNEDGTYGITQSVVVTVDKASIASAEKDTDSFFQAFQSWGNEYIGKLLASFNTACANAESDEEDTPSGYSQKVRNLGKVGDEQVFYTVAELRSYVYAHMKPVKYDDAEDDKWYAVRMDLNFDKIYAYKCFWTMLDPYSDGSDVESGEVVDDKFYKKTIYTQYSVFHGITEENYATWSDSDALKQIITNIESFFNNQYNLNNQNLTYTYSLATPQTHFYTDADYIDEDEYGNDVYTWEFSSADLNTENGDQMITWTISYHTANWYLLAIYVTIIAGVVLLLVATIKGEKKKQ